MPSTPTVFQWLRLDPAFAQAYTRAREHQAEGYADEIASIADAAQGMDSAGVNAARLRVDARKWVASKLLPKRYGDRIDLNHQGGISVAAVSKALATVKPITFDDMDDVEDVEDVAQSTERAKAETASSVPAASSNERAGKEHASVETPTGEGVHPGKGTPETVTGRVTPVAQNPKIPSDFQQSSDDISTMGAPLSCPGGITADQQDAPGGSDLAQRAAPTQLSDLL
jgi:hypothetical protein